MDTRDPTGRYGHFTERTELPPDEPILGERLSAERYAAEAGKQQGFIVMVIVVTVCVISFLAAAYSGLSRVEAAYQIEGRV